MKEKSKYLLHKAETAAINLLIGLLGPFFLWAAEAPAWTFGVAYLAWVAVTSVFIFSPRARRFAHSYRGDAHVERYTLLEAELDRLRTFCVTLVREDGPRVRVVRWRGRRWDAIAAPYLGDRAVLAFIPGVFCEEDQQPADDSRGREFRVLEFDACVVARYDGKQWSPTDLFPIGSLDECRASLATRVNGDDPRPGSPDSRERHGPPSNRR